MAATLRSYANLKEIEFDGVEIEVEAERRTPSQQKEADEDAKATVIRKKITIKGDKLTDKQRERMLQIADKCPVSKALRNGVDFA